MENDLIIQNNNGSWKLGRFQGCSGLVVSYNSYIIPSKRGKGLGKKEHRKRIRIAKLLDYSCMICTVRADNEIEKKILKKYHWKKVHEFYNKKTTNIVEIWVKNI